MNMLKIRETVDKKSWESFLEKRKDFYPLFQSWNWGEVQKTGGNSVFRFALVDNKKNMQGICCAYLVEAKRGRYLHVRHGPILSSFSPSSFEIVLNKLKEIARENTASFIRMSPFVSKKYIEQSFLKSKGLILSPLYYMDAQRCWILDIRPSEEELLKNMRKSHRYLIKKALQMDIKIIKSSDISYFDTFNNLYKSLAHRKQFVPHKLIKEEIEIFSKDNQAQIFLAQYGSKYIASAIVLYVKNMAIYHHAASLDEFKNIPASYLIQWNIIQEAKKRGLSYYNFWGVSSENSKDHPWYGHSLFKRGFGGSEYEFVPSYDLPLAIWYWRTYAIEQFSKWRKGY